MDSDTQLSQSKQTIVQNKNSDHDTAEVEIDLSDKCENVQSKVEEMEDKNIKKGNIITRYFKRKAKGLTKRQMTILLVFAFVEFFAATIISIQAPFYPAEAKKKGATATEAGFVFGIFEITVFIMSPIFGTYMGKFGTKKLFNAGILTTGVCCIIFGLLNFIEDRTAFIALSIFVRFVEAVGDAAFVVSSFTIIALEFPNSVATTFATMETLYGFGMIAGPTIGGCLYELGGYSLPFILCGVCLFICALATYFLLPPQETKNSDDLPVSHGLAIFRILKIPSIAMIAYSIIATASGAGFLAATISLHLIPFNLNAVALGAIIMLNGGVYAITAPLFGWICDNAKQPKYVTLSGAIFTIIAFLIIGPAPFFPFETNLWVTCIGLIIFGLGLGAVLISAFIQCLQDAIKRGYSDDVRTYGLISGLWVSSVALSFFIGPSAGGVLYDYVGFRWGTMFILAGQLLLVCLVIAYLVHCHLQKQSFSIEQGETKLNSTDTNNKDVYGMDNIAYVKEETKEIQNSTITT